MLYYLSLFLQNVRRGITAVESSLKCRSETGGLRDGYVVLSNTWCLTWLWLTWLPTVSWSPTKVIVS